MTSTRIDIRRHHELGPEKARAVIAHIADSLESRFGIVPKWRGEALHFARSGVDGFITADASEVHVSARLGMLVAPLKPMIEAEVLRKLDKYFPTSTAPGA